MTAGFCLCVSATAASQGLPSEPVTLGHGKVTIGGNVTATFACARLQENSSCGDDTGFFNYTDYEHSNLRMARVAVNAAVRASRQFSFLAEIRSENGQAPQAYALYARIRPWPARPFDLQIGRVPPTFGAFARRAYASDNLVIGMPLAYQYLTSLRPDALPADTDELLRMRGRGWLSRFTMGDTTAAHGLPLASALRWDTGIQTHAAAAWGDASFSVTNGSLGNPLVSDDNAGKQLSGRLAVRPMVGLVLGVSATRAPYLTRSLVRAIGRDGDGNGFTQTAWGTDVEYSRGYYLLRGEAVMSRWLLPTLAPTLRATALMVEGRYKLRPGLYASGRVDHLGFSRVSGATLSDEWDAPVTRVEVATGYLLRRNLEFKVAVQRNVRDGGRVPRLTLGAAQLGFWF